MDLRVDFRGVAPVPFGRMVGRVETGRTDAAPRQGRRTFLSRLNRRRFACLKAAAEAVDVLPDEGESWHCIMSGNYDLMHLLIVLLHRLGARCETMRVATLSLSRRNVQEMAALLDGGKVGRLEILTSHFAAKYDADIFSELLQEFGARGQRVAVARSHAKIVTLSLEDGRPYTVTGSANLRTNKNIEQVELTRDAELHAHYDTWLKAMIDVHEVRPSDRPATG